MTATTTLMDTLAKVERDAEGDTISLGDVVASLNNRGFGTLLLPPSLLIVLPTGAIPFLPAICSIFMILICSQILMGRKHPWLPRVLKKRAISKSQYEKAMKSAGPLINILDRITHPRLKILTHHTAQRIIALMVIILSILIAVVAVFPFAADPLGLAILCFALGLSARDGIMTLAGFIVTVVALGFLPWIITSSQGFVGPQFIAPLPVSL